jgi:hypothetical protein
VSPPTNSSSAASSFSADDRRQAFLGWRLDDFQQMPVPLNNMRVEKLDRRVADAHGIGLPFVDILTEWYYGSYKVECGKREI